MSEFEYEPDPGMVIMTQLKNVRLYGHVLPTPGVGDRVRITSGPFEGFDGYVHVISGPRVTLRTGDPAEWKEWDAR